MTQRTTTSINSAPEVKTGKQHSTEIDAFYWIRIISCFAIILLHSLFASNVYFEETITEGELLWSSMVENLLMWAVPCFLMVTGVLLLDPDRDIPASRIYGRYLKRVVLALLVFTLVFQILGYLMEGEQTIIRGWLSDLFLGHSWAHMWYLYLMIGIYLMMPFYRMVVRSVVRPEGARGSSSAPDMPGSSSAPGTPGKAEAVSGCGMLDVLILLIFVFTSVTSLFRAFGVEPAFYIPTTIIYPLYLFVGYRLYHKPLPAHNAAVLTVLCSAAIVALTVMRYRTGVLTGVAEALSGSSGAAELDYLFDYYSPLVVLQSAGVFSLMCRIPAAAGSFIKTLDSCTFGIYLIHMIGIHAIMKWAGFDPYSYGPFAFILMAMLLFAVSFAITWLIRLIPGADLL